MKLCFTEIEDLFRVDSVVVLLWQLNLLGELRQLLLCTYGSINLCLAVPVKLMKLGIKAELPLFCPRLLMTALRGTCETALIWFASTVTCPPHSNHSDHHVLLSFTPFNGKPRQFLPAYFHLSNNGLFWVFFLFFFLTLSSFYLQMTTSLRWIFELQCHLLWRVIC